MAILDYLRPVLNWQPNWQPLDYVIPVLNWQLSFTGLASGIPIEKWHIDDTHKHSKIRKYFSSDKKAEALRNLQENEHLDTTYLTDLSVVNPELEKYIKARQKCIPDGLNNDELKDKFGELSHELKQLAIPPLLQETEALCEKTSEDNKEITMDALYNRVKKIQDQMKVQLDKDIKHIEACFTDENTKKFKDDAGMEAKQIRELKVAMLAAVNHSYNAALKTFNDELENQYKKAENDHDLLLVLAVVLQNDPKMKEKFDQQMLAAQDKATKNAQSLGVNSAEGPAGVPIRKLDRDVAKDIVYKPLKAKDLSTKHTPWFEKLAENGHDAFYTSITGQPIEHARDKEDNKTLYRIQFPARIPCGPIARLLTELIWDTKLSGRYFSTYYSNRQDHIKIEYLSMAERLWAEGYRKVTINISHCPKDEEMTHALEHARKAVAASCEAGFESKHIEVVINGRAMPLYDRPYSDGRKDSQGRVQTEKGLFHSKDDLDVVAKKAEQKIKAKEDVRNFVPGMGDIGKAVKELRAAREKAEAEAKAKKEKEKEENAESTPRPNKQ